METDQAEEHGDRPRENHQRHRHRQRCQERVDQVFRSHQQPEQHEHGDLGEPGDCVEKDNDGVVRPVARLPTINPAR
jgi:hypothetical protein